MGSSSIREIPRTIATRAPHISVSGVALIALALEGLAGSDIAPTIGKVALSGTLAT